MSESIARLIRACLTVVGAGLILFALFSDKRSADERWLAALAVGGLMIAAGRWPDLSRVRDLAQRGAVRIGLALTVGFALVAVQLLRMQAINASTTASRVGTDPATGDVFSNPRTINLATTSKRGAILDRSETVLAKTKLSHGVAYRQYPEPASSYVCGYFSPLKYGLSGLEKTRDGQLTGQESGNRLRRELDSLLGRPPTGQDLVLTLDVALQSQAQDLLRDHIGAAVVIEVATGAVLVLASAPNFDPEQLAAVDDETARTASAYWSDLSSDPTHPLVLRATQGLYPPGSTFKTVTASAAIDLGLATPDDVFQDNGSLYVDGHVITENNRPDDRVEWTLRDGLAYSLNVVFAQVGMMVGAENLTKYAERFGFGADIPFDVPVAPGQVFGHPGFLDAQSAVADTGFGQGELLTTPLAMALVAATIANGGATMRPYIVAETRDGSGKTTSKTKPAEWRRPISKTTASTVRDLMVNDITNGYAYAAAIDGYVVGGKTGTAETNTDLPHAWFIGFVGENEPKYAVSVLLEHGGEGTHDALGIGREMLLSTITKYP
jgi:peptidoglycan glycosyltransferase